MAIPAKLLFIPYVILSAVLVSLLILSFICYQKKKRHARNQDAALVRYNDSLHLVKKSRINLRRANIGEIVDFCKDPHDLSDVIRKHPELNPYQTKVSVIGRWKRILNSNGQSTSKQSPDTIEGDAQTTTDIVKNPEARSRWNRLTSRFKSLKDGEKVYKSTKLGSVGVAVPKGNVNTVGEEKKSSVAVDGNDDKGTIGSLVDSEADIDKVKKPFHRRLSSRFFRMVSRQKIELDKKTHKQTKNSYVRSVGVVGKETHVEGVLSTIHVAQADKAVGETEREDDGELEIISC